MYIQPPFSIPKGYSGNAFPDEPTVEASIKEEASAEEVIDQTPAAPEGAQEQENAESEKEAVAASAAPSGGGIFSRFPFLSSLLPPPRRKKEKGGSLSEWVVIGIFLFLILEDNDQDLLPFLLLLLLWD